jgi:hypothetical protein
MRAQKTISFLEASVTLAARLAKQRVTGPILEDRSRHPENGLKTAHSGAGGARTRAIAPASLLVARISQGDAL